MKGKLRGRRRVLRFWLSREILVIGCAATNNLPDCPWQTKKKTTQAEQQQGEQYTTISSLLLSNKQLFKTSREK
jgi:hypothetical protein